MKREVVSPIIYFFFNNIYLGETWDHIGLEGTKHISQVRIHPSNPEIIYVSGMFFNIKMEILTGVQLMSVGLLDIATLYMDLY